MKRTIYIRCIHLLGRRLVEAPLRESNSLVTTQIFSRTLIRPA